MDFDTDFMTEEEQLRDRDDLDWDNNLIRVPVREPGSQLALPGEPVEVDEAAPAPAPLAFEDDGLEADEDALGGPFVMSDADNHETRWLDDEPFITDEGYGARRHARGAAAHARPGASPKPSLRNTATRSLLLRQLLRPAPCYGRSWAMK